MVCKILRMPLLLASFSMSALPSPCSPQRAIETQIYGERRKRLHYKPRLFLTADTYRMLGQ